MTAQQVKDERTAGAVQSHTSCYASAHQLVCGHRGYTSRGSKSCPLPISYDCYQKCDCLSSQIAIACIYSSCAVPPTLLSPSPKRLVRRGRRTSYEITI